jgi:hypothetical protein
MAWPALTRWHTFPAYFSFQILPVNMTTQFYSTSQLDIQYSRHQTSVMHAHHSAKFAFITLLLFCYWWLNHYFTEYNFIYSVVTYTIIYRRFANILISSIHILVTFGHCFISTRCWWLQKHNRFPISRLHINFILPLLGICISFKHSSNWLIFYTLDGISGKYRGLTSRNSRRSHM